MKMDNLKNAFGSTPESVKECVLRSLREEQRREPVMKKRMTLSLAIALAVVMALGCAAFAATQLEGIAGIFGFTNHETGETVVNEAAISHIQALNETYEGKTVRFTLTEGMYSPMNRNLSLGWTLEPLNEGEMYYVLCDVQVGGMYMGQMMMSRVTEYILSRAEQCVLSALTEQPVHQDHLADTLELSPVELMSVVTKLAMANLVSVYPGKMIALKKG